MSPAEAREIVRLYGEWPVVTPTAQLIVNASLLHEQESISFWDALIVEAARVAGATSLLTEDLSHGRSFGRVRVEDPFDASAGSAVRPHRTGP